MFDSHLDKFGPLEDLAAQIGEKWFLVSRCKCGSIHAYEILSDEPDKDVPRLSADELTGEIKKHLSTRLQLVPKS